MKYTVLIVIILVALIASGCSNLEIPIKVLENPTPIRPTLTSIPPTMSPTATITLKPTSTPLPGSQVYPIDSLKTGIPWLPMDNSARPTVYFYYFNLKKPPFDNVLVRQAFAAAINKEEIVDLANSFSNTEYRPATNFTPPEIIGRDLYNEVGIAYNPDHAIELLAQAGYTDMSTFPSVSLAVPYSDGASIPGFHTRIATEIAAMWQQNLGVNVTVKTEEWQRYRSIRNSDPPEIFQLGWAADYNDPDNFLREIFKYDSQFNFGFFYSNEFNRIVEQAEQISDPAKRQELYITAEQILCEEKAAIIPLMFYKVNIP